MKNRSRLDITAEILNAASAGALKTKIMYSAALTFDQLNDYLSVLVDSGLLKYDAKKKVYKTTDKGHDFLTKYGKLAWSSSSSFFKVRNTAESDTPPHFLTAAGPNTKMISNMARGMIISVNRRSRSYLILNFI